MPPEFATSTPTRGLAPDPTQDSDAVPKAAFARWILGESEAFRDLVALLQHRVYGYLAHRLGDRSAAEDAAQEVFLKLHLAKGRGLLPEPDGLLPWLFTVAHHTAADRFRWNARRPLSLVGDARALEASSQAAADPLVAAEESAASTARVRTWLTALPPAQAECLALRVFARLTFPALAGVLGIPEATAKSRVRYALQTLRNAVPAPPSEDSR